MCVNATEKLLHHELVVPTGAKAMASVKKEQQPLRLTVDEGRIEDIFEKNLDVPSHLKTWATERVG